MVLILSDSDVARSCTASRAIAVLRKAIYAHGEGRLAAPPRTHSAMARGSLVYTAGALDDLVHGVRVEDRGESEQVVAVWDSASGRLAAVVLGHELGRRRTGAIGAVAVDTLARQNAASLGVIGTGNQAWAQVWAATSVRPWRSIAIYSRNSYVRERFAARCREQLLVDAIAVDSPEAAVRGKDAIIVATNSSTPVFDTSWLDPGTHVSTLGPKTISAHEVPLDLLDRVDVLVTDSLAQVHGYTEPYALSTRRMVELGAVMTGALPGRTDPEQITLFCSVGLAGTEVVLAADLSGLPTGPAPVLPAAVPVVAVNPPIQDLADAAAAEAAAVLAGPTADPTPPNGLAEVVETTDEAAESAEKAEQAASTEETAPSEDAVPSEDAALAVAATDTASDDTPPDDTPPDDTPPDDTAPAEEADEADAGLDIVLGGEPEDVADKEGEVAESAEAPDEPAEPPESKEHPDAAADVVPVGAETEEKRPAREHQRSSKRLPKPRGGRT